MTTIVESVAGSHENANPIPSSSLFTLLFLFFLDKLPTFFFIDRLFRIIRAHSLRYVQCLSLPSHKRCSLYFTTFSCWLLSSPTSKILIRQPPEVFDPDRQILPLLEYLFGHTRLIFSRLIGTDEKGIPSIDDWFHQCFDLSETELVCWINGDILIPKGWLPRLTLFTIVFLGLVHNLQFYRADVILIYRFQISSLR
jgi:hypothetical protein